MEKTSSEVRTNEVKMSVNNAVNGDKKGGGMLYVKDSQIHGKGLFAKKKIKQGEILGYIKGTPTTTDGPYVLWLKGMEEGVVVECDLKYINHNSNPNACYYDDLSVVALRDINKDEEITHHYGEDWDESDD